MHCAALYAFRLGKAFVQSGCKFTRNDNQNLGIALKSGDSHRSCATLSMMDQVHGRPDGTARKRFNDHIDKMIDGRHFHKVAASEFRTRLDSSHSKFANEDVTLLTERGYLVLVKSFTDDLVMHCGVHRVGGDALGIIGTETGFAEPSPTPKTSGFTC